MREGCQACNAQLKVRELQGVQAIKESEIELHLREENMRVLAERERLQLRSQLMQDKIDAERAEVEATFREPVGDDSVTTPAGSVRVRENVERYLTGFTSSVIPGQPFEDEPVKPETGKYALAEVKVDPHELKFLSGGATPHGVPTFLEAHVDHAKVVAMVRMLTLIIQWASSKRLWLDSKRLSITLYLVLKSWICRNASFCTLMVTLRSTPGLSRTLSLMWNLRSRMTMSGCLI